MKRYTINTITAKIDLSDYIRHYRDTDKFMHYCKACDKYNSCWTCPPFDFDCEKYISPYSTAYIIGSKIILDKELINESRDAEGFIKTMYAITEEVRKGLDKNLLTMESKLPDSKAFFAGSCQICPKGECARIKGKQCVAPHRTRPSLESFGFDIVKTSAELLKTEIIWSQRGQLPPYIVLVSGLFTTLEISESIEIL